MARARKRYLLIYRIDSGGENITEDCSVPGLNPGVASLNANLGFIALCGNHLIRLTAVRTLAVMNLRGCNNGGLSRGFLRYITHPNPLQVTLRA